VPRSQTGALGTGARAAALGRHDKLHVAERSRQIGS